MGGRSRYRSTGIAAGVAQALRAAVACAPPAFMPVPAAAQSVGATTLSAAIPAEPIRDALAAFANQTGVQLVYVSGVVHNQRSHAVAAGVGVEEALTRLLQGTGLRYEYLTPNSIRILTAASKSTAAPPEQAAEVLVTANRRVESVQDVPMSVQVLSGATLARLNAQTFDDFVGYLPGVTAHGVGASQNHILLRGLGGGEGGVQGGAFGDVFPSVAIYLDE